MDNTENQINRALRIKENLKNVCLTKIHKEEDPTELLHKILDDKMAEKDLKQAANSLLHIVHKSKRQNNR